MDAVDEKVAMDEKVSTSSGNQKRATLDAGRKKLEEFRRKKEAQQEIRAQQAKLVEAQPILAEKAKEREEELKQQCAELLASVDDLHRCVPCRLMRAILPVTQHLIRRSRSPPLRP
jgi:hypothetical protein